MLWAADTERCISHNMGSTQYYTVTDNLPKNRSKSYFCHTSFHGRDANHTKVPLFRHGYASAWAQLCAQDPSRTLTRAGTTVPGSHFLIILTFHRLHLHRTHKTPHFCQTAPPSVRAAARMLLNSQDWRTDPTALAIAPTRPIRRAIFASRPQSPVDGIFPNPKMSI